jgi:CxxC motif-containing protein (DUF1111 family)
VCLRRSSWRPTRRLEVIFLGALAAACGESRPAVVEADPGEPLPGLTSAQLTGFEAGRALFNRAFAPEEGLGPLYNQTRCSSCHDLPESGGHGAEPVSRFSRFDPVTGCDVLASEGGDLIQQVVVESARERGVQPERVPPSATAVTDIVPPPIYGVGLIEALTSEDIRSRADPDDVDGDGISGRTGQAPDGSLGRFGRKANHGSLAAFVETALRLEMGLTTPAHPREEAPNGVPLPEDLDPAPDPEVSQADLDLLVTYSRFLAPPGPGSIEPREAGNVRAGERLFGDVGCTDCHVPVWTTGPSDITALDRVSFRLYSDLLVHDMGPDLADVCAPDASPSEWRTTPLVGLGLRSVFLHNGRAQRLTDAIRLHGGEAEVASAAFQRLPPPSQAQVLAFLRSL